MSCAARVFALPAASFDNPGVIRCLAQSFTRRFADAYFRTVARHASTVIPDHLDLGSRFACGPPKRSKPGPLGESLASIFKRRSPMTAPKVGPISMVWQTGLIGDVSFRLERFAACSREAASARDRRERENGGPSPTPVISVAVCRQQDSSGGTWFQDSTSP